ncbi:SURF1 family protein [Sphingomonas floccifaciens]|uniref:SURF1-like protein n=1 Tax=Sphingomonas floccifaciens TaxID=1844115 RepID=A0ABW4NI12_9SPHN
MAALVTAGLIALGVWQLERRAWKLDLIARVDARIHAAPAAFPWAGGDPRELEYRRVRLTGSFEHARETLVQALTARGAGFWVLTPLRTPEGTVLVNRGFVPEDRRDPNTRAAGQVAGPVAVTGLVRLTEPGGGFLRSNDPAAGRWYSRDVAAIAAARGLAGRIAPLFVDADGTPNSGGYPVGGLTVVAFRNTHLVYALTWFALAALAGAGTWLFWRGRAG